MAPYNLLELLPLILLVLLHSSRTAHALLQPSCSVNSSDTNFQNNLYGLLSSITTGAPINGGFFNNMVSTSSDQIYGLGICYADADPTACNSCLSKVAYSITTDCPDSKDASFWLDTGPCFIRYSNVNFFSVADTTWYLMYNIGNYSDSELFGNVRNELFEKLIVQTTASANMMASGEESLKGTDKLYGLLQCTRDLNHQECYKCLSTLINFLQPPSLYADSLGVRFFGFSCYVHYEMHPIMPTQQGTGTKLPKKSNTTIIIVAVVVGVAALLVVLTTIFWFKKKASAIHRSTMAMMPNLDLSNFTSYHQGGGFGRALK